jgi:hypothetical protein
LDPRDSHPTLKFRLALQVAAHIIRGQFHIGDDKDLQLYIAVDEYQNLLLEHAEGDSEEEKAKYKRSALSLMHRSIFGAYVNPPAKIIPLYMCAGIVFGDLQHVFVNSGANSYKFLRLPLLSIESIEHVVEHYFSRKHPQVHWRTDEHFRLGLRLFGVVPRHLETYIEECLKAKKQMTFNGSVEVVERFGELAIKNLNSRFFDYVTFTKPSDETIFILVAYSFSGQKAYLNTRIDGYSLEFLVSAGACSYDVESQSPVLPVATLQFLLTVDTPEASAAQELKEAVARWVDFISQEASYILPFQMWERLPVYFLLLRIAALRYLNIKTLPLLEFLGGKDQAGVLVGNDSLLKKYDINFEQHVLLNNQKEPYRVDHHGQNRIHICYENQIAIDSFWDPYLKVI